ncbi:hypothetical protein SSS_08513 [Sarcoptes scabiei]|uniref:Diuretic hormone class 2 n=1 Tax=Sarcoptes scabiei TaxID=52283 RepID=A0A834R922_SARSC|nr:hypothetical protein SSS_08513 [Sarcoptes scabiei]
MQNENISEMIGEQQYVNVNENSLFRSNRRLAMNSKRSTNLILSFVVATILILYLGSIQSNAYPLNLMMTRKYPVNVEIENPEELISTMDNLIQSILAGIDSSHSSGASSNSPNKRGIDLGLSRGFSGSQAAKHLMGMSAASFANGPGRRRR